jgi:tRNA dimethylallyltransferase
MKKASLAKIVVILGPTSAGKSEVAIRLAQKFNGEIISADSRQIYRRLDIGTGKIRGTWNVERGTFVSEGIDHFMIDIVSPRTIFSAAQFKKKADQIIEDILKRGKLPIICGGTGFWIKSVVDNVTYPEVKPDWQLRKKLEQKSVSVLFKMLQKLDPQRAKNIDAKNPVRLIRAIEICKAIGKVPEAKTAPKYTALQIGIDIAKENLHQNIAKRLKKRWRAGMIKEVENLKKSGLSWKKIQSFGLSYFWIPLYLQKKISKQELLERVLHAEKDYAKRQMTWFQKDRRILWLKNYKTIEKSTKNFLK